MLKHDDARVASETNVQTLTGSSAPGSVTNVAEMPDTWETLGDAANRAVAAIGERMAKGPAAVSPDTDLIEFADEIALLVEEERAASNETSALSDRIMIEHPYPLEGSRWGSDYLREDLRTRRTRMRADAICEAERNIETVEQWEQAKHLFAQEIGLARAEAKAAHLVDNVETFVGELTRMSSESFQGIVAKSNVARALHEHGLGDNEWSLELSRSITGDVLRLNQIKVVSPDAALLALGRVFEAQRTCVDDTAEAMEIVMNGMKDPPAPKALFWKTGADEAWVGCFQTRHCGTGRSWYGDPKSIEKMRTQFAPESAVARCQEIVAAFDGWMAEIKSIEEASGFKAAEALHNQTVEESLRISRLIARTPARTLEGLLFKAQVAARSYGGVESVEEQFEMEASDGDAEALSISILRDLVQMLPASQTTSRNTAQDGAMQHSAARHVAECYRTLLHFELRELNVELDGMPLGLGGIWLDNPAAQFHYAAGGSWKRAPLPSTRAAMVLALFGIDWRTAVPREQEGEPDGAAAAA